MTASEPGQLSAIEKLVAVVEALASESRLSAIARATGLATSTVHRILQGLVQVGWVHEDPDHGYLLGARLLAVTARADDASFLVQVAGRHLRELRDAIGDTVHLAVRRGDEMAYVAKLDGRKAYQMRSHVGLTVPMHCTAVGKAYLAAVSDEEVLATVSRCGLPPRTEHTLASAEGLLANLRAVRAQGFAMDEQENEANIRCIAAVIMGHRAQPVASVSMSSLVFDLTDAKVPGCAALVTRAAGRISRALGYQAARERGAKDSQGAPH